VEVKAGLSLDTHTHIIILSQWMRNVSISEKVTRGRLLVTQDS